MAKEPAVLSLDIGTSSVKAALIGATGNVLALERQPYQQSFEKSWLDGIRKVFRAIKAESSGALALTASAQGPTIFPLFASGTYGAPLLYNDGFAEPIAKSRSFFLPKIASLKKRQPLLYQRTRLFLPCGDFFAYLLCGRAVCSLPHNGYIPLIWDAASSAAAQIDSAKLPPFLKWGQIIGETAQEAARFFHLPSKLPICASMFDFLAALLGANCLNHGDVLDRAGTSEGINFTLNQAIPANKLSGQTRDWRILPHAIENLYNAGIVFNGTGSALQQVMQTNGYKKEGYEAFFADAMAGKEPARTAAFTAAEHLASVLADFKAFEPKQIKLCGGQSYNENFNKIKERCVGRPLYRLRCPEAELLGAAALSFYTLGFMPSLKEAAALFI